MNKPETWIVDQDAIRPAGPKDACCYCREPFGGAHKPDCVLRKKSVVVKFTGQCVIVIPQDWTEENVNFRYDGSSHCTNNLFNGLADAINHEDEKCLCSDVEVVYEREATEEDERDLMVVDELSMAVHLEDAIQNLRSFYARADEKERSDIRERFFAKPL